MHATLKTIVEEFVKVSLYSYYDKTLPDNFVDKGYMKRAVKNTYIAFVEIIKNNDKPESLMTITEKLVNVALSSYFNGITKQFNSVIKRIVSNAYNVLFGAIQQTRADNAHNIESNC